MQRLLPAILLVAALAACNKSEVKFDYGRSGSTYCAGAPGVPLKPSVTGRAARFSVTPALPAGLALDPSDGSISGTPTAAAAPAEYVISAMGKEGEVVATQSLNLGVEAALAFASPIRYRQDSLVSTSPATAGSGLTRCTIDPPLPPGLSLDSVTCRISGKPTEATPARDYRISAVGACGTDSARVSIAVIQTRPVTELRASRLDRTKRPVRKPSRFKEKGAPSRF